MRHRIWRAVLVGAVFVSAVIAVAAPSYWRGENSPLGVKLFSFSMPLQIDDLSKPGGRLFRARSKDGRFACSAHFVYAVSSRLTTNSNQLEFFCRETDRAPDVRFERVGGIDNKNVSKNNIAYFDGRLIDITNSVTILNDGELIPFSDSKEFKNGRIYYISRMRSGEYLLFQTDYKRDGERCSDLSIVDDENKYYGSVKISSYVSYFNGRALFDFEGDLFATDELRPLAKCASLGVTKIRGGIGWPYGGIRTDKGFLLGGSGIPANLYEVSPDLSTRTIPIDAQATFVSEVYSYIPLNGRVLIGTYPAGYPFSVSAGVKATAVKEDFFPLGKSRWTNPRDGAPYRELQSMASSYGILWGGMYPWGEVIANDRLSRTTNRYRLFSHPVHSPSLRVPYASEVAREVSDFWAGSFDTIPSFAEARRKYSESDELPRELGLFGDAWGQRIQQIVIRNGGLCASTGSMGDTPYEPTVHTHLTPEQYGEYGTVWCADLAGQVLADIQAPGSYSVEFSVFENGVSIKIGAETTQNITPINRDIEAAFSSQLPKIESAVPVTFTGG